MEWNVENTEQLYTSSCGNNYNIVCRES